MQMVNEKSRAYARKYYQRNRDEISRKKREKYRTDPEYKAKAVQRVMQRYRKRRQEKLERIKAGLEVRRVRGYPRPRVVQIGGKQVLVHSVAAFGHRVGRSVQTITAWEKAGIVPPPTLRDELGRRWYCDEHIDRIVAALDTHQRSGGRSLMGLKQVVSTVVDTGDEHGRGYSCGVCT